MTNRRTLKFSIWRLQPWRCACRLAAAQGGYYPDYGHNRNGNYGRYDERYLRILFRGWIGSQGFRKDLNRALDHGRGQWLA
jgi:hypothetical protein